MERDTFSTVAEHPAVDYAHLPGEEHNPLMESTAHVDWSVMLLNACRHVQAGTGNLVTGNVPFVPADGPPHLAPDLMVIPGAAGRSFGRYEPGPDNPMPLVCVEIVSPSNTAAILERRTRRFLASGIPEVYVLDPRRDTVVRMELDGADLVARPAIGIPSPGLGLTFTEVDGHLGVCCPAGRIVRPGDDPFGWLADEMWRADRAELRADLAEEEADLLRRQAEESRRQAEESRRQAEVAEARIRNLQLELERLRGGQTGPAEAAEGSAHPLDPDGTGDRER